MQAAQHNILLKGYFNKKTKAKEKTARDAEEKKEEEQKATDN
jgi:hypothetical protein